MNPTPSDISAHASGSAQPQAVEADSDADFCEHGTRHSQNCVACESSDRASAARDQAQGGVTDAMVRIAEDARVDCLQRTTAYGSMGVQERHDRAMRTALEAYEHARERPSAAVRVSSNPQLDRVNGVIREVERWLAAVAGDGSLCGAAASECRQAINLGFADALRMEATPPAPRDAEPVAWQAKPPHYEHWTMIDKRHVAEYESEGWLVRGLVPAQHARSAGEGADDTPAHHLLIEACELLGAIGVDKAGKYGRHNACNLRNRIDAFLQRERLAATPSRTDEGK